MSFSRVGPNQTIERGQFRVAKSVSSLGIPPKLTSNFLCVSFRVLGQYPEKLSFGWTKFRGAGHSVSNLLEELMLLRYPRD